MRRFTQHSHEVRGHTCGVYGFHVSPNEHYDRKKGQAKVCGPAHVCLVLCRLLQAPALAIATYRYIYIYVYICVCTYTYTYTYTHTYRHTHTYTLARCVCEDTSVHEAMVRKTRRYKIHIVSILPEVYRIIIDIIP